MREAVITGLIVGMALYFTGRSFVRSVRVKGQGGCGSGCRGCSCASRKGGSASGDCSRPSA